MRETLFKIVATNKYIVTTNIFEPAMLRFIIRVKQLKPFKLFYSDDEPEHCRLENLVVTIYLLVATILNNASRNFIHYTSQWKNF